VITQVRVVGICVSDQDRALDFYINKLSFEKRRDDPMGPDARWIEVAPRGAQTVLVLFTPPGLESRIGTFANVVLACDDIQKTFQELRGRGVEITEEPTQQPWGMMAQLRDADGNGFVLVQE